MPRRDDSACREEVPQPSPPPPEPQAVPRLWHAKSLRNSGPPVADKECDENGGGISERSSQSVSGGERVRTHALQYQRVLLLLTRVRRHRLYRLRQSSTRISQASTATTAATKKIEDKDADQCERRSERVCAREIYAGTGCHKTACRGEGGRGGARAPCGRWVVSLEHVLAVSRR
jgi:hypothetical protein